MAQQDEHVHYAMPTLAAESINREFHSDIILIQQTFSKRKHLHEF